MELIEPSCNHSFPNGDLFCIVLLGGLEDDDEDDDDEEEEDDGGEVAGGKFNVPGVVLLLL